MRTDVIDLGPEVAGSRHQLAIHRFGRDGARPRVYVQAALHADEIPGMMVAHRLRRRLSELDRAGRIAGEIVLVPVANPIGLSQRVLGTALGRFDLADGHNFNRHFARLGPAVREQVDGQLTSDAVRNTRLIRRALAQAVAALRPATASEHLKARLLDAAVDADWVLDLHCDSEAVMHLYTMTGTATDFAPLAALLEAQAVLVADVSGDDPFDEACSRPWIELQDALPGVPVPLGCKATTVELRGQADVSGAMADADAGAIAGFMTVIGVIDGPLPVVPPSRATPTPLEASEPLIAATGGIVDFHRTVGDLVQAGDVVATIIDPVSGATSAVAARSDGVLYARSSARFAMPGRRLGKIAGTTLRRAGNLLSP